MDDALARRLQDSIGTAFTLERELGGGGMARVFVARQGDLERQVVVKVLDLEVSADAGAERFRREIKLIAALQHPHIVPVLTAGSSGSLLWYAMPFVSGESLRARLVREGALPLGDALRIAREMLDALSYAHEKGIVHRDIKPENILLEGKHAVVADFGVAKALREAGISGGLTTAGMALGTPAYMAPEQAMADPTTNHRADLYATGAVLYEMLVGAPPYSGNAQAVIAAHLTAPVPRVEERRGDVPASVAALIARLMTKNAAERPQSAHEALAVLEAVTTPSSNATGAQALSGVGSPVQGAAVTSSGGDAARVAAPLAADASAAGTGAARAADATPSAASGGPAPPSRSRTGRMAAAAILVAALAAGGTWWAKRTPASDVVAGADVIAVMPLSSTGDSAMMRLGRDLVVTLSTNLDGVGALRATDAMGVLMRAQKLPQPLPLADARALASDLGAKSVVHGALVQEGSGVRADVALYRVEGGDAIARASATAPRDGIRTLTDSLTAQLLRQVWRRGAAPSPFLADVATSSMDALRAFLEGEQHFQRLYVDSALASYTRALQLDSMFAQAAFRLDYVRNWALMPPDTAARAQLLRNSSRLAPRDQAWLNIHRRLSLPFAVRLDSGRALAARYPDFGLAQYSVADDIIHSGPTYGVAITDALPYLDRADVLTPNQPDLIWHRSMVLMAGHDTARFRANIEQQAAGPLGAARSQAVYFRSVLDARARQRPTPASAFGTMMGDFMPLLRAAPQLSWIVVGGAPVLGMSGQQMDSITGEMERSGAYTGLELPHGLGASSLAASRGQFVAASSRLAAVERPDVPEPIALAGARLAAISAWMGFLTIEQADSVLVRARARRPQLSSIAQAEFAWLDGLIGVAAADSARVVRAAAANTDTSKQGRFLAQSLPSLWRERRTGLIDSLQALEDRTIAAAGLHAAALPVHRLALGRALVKQGSPARAERYLQWPDAMTNSLRGTSVQSQFASVTAYERGLAAEAAGDRANAIMFFQRFVEIADAPDPPVRPLVENAKARLAKLTGDSRK